MERWLSAVEIGVHGLGEGAREERCVADGEGVASVLYTDERITISISYVMGVFSKNVRWDQVVTMTIACHKMAAPSW